MKGRVVEKVGVARERKIGQERERGEMQRMEGRREREETCGGRGKGSTGEYLQLYTIL